MVLTAMSSTGIGTGSLRATSALSSLAMMSPTMATILTTRVPILVSGNKEHTSNTVYREREKDTTWRLV